MCSKVFVGTVVLELEQLDKTTVGTVVGGETHIYIDGVIGFETSYFRIILYITKSNIGPVPSYMGDYEMNFNLFTSRRI